MRTGSATIPNKRIRSSGNPGGANHGNIKKYFIDAGPESSIVEGDDGMKRMYIRSLVTDNKILLERDPGYIKRLEGRWRRGTDRRMAERRLERFCRSILYQLGREKDCGTVV